MLCESQECFFQACFISLKMWLQVCSCAFLCWFQLFMCTTCTQNRLCLYFCMLPCICFGQYTSESLFHVLSNRKKLELQCTYCITDMHLYSTTTLEGIFEGIGLWMFFSGFHLLSQVHFYCEFSIISDNRPHFFGLYVVHYYFITCKM